MRHVIRVLLLGALVALVALATTSGAWADQSYTDPNGDGGVTICPDQDVVSPAGQTSAGYQVAQQANRQIKVLV